MALIEVRDLEFHEHGREVLSGISLSIEEGQRVAILGGNHSGKTALARWLAGWLPAQSTVARSGSVTFQGQAWSALPLAERASAVQLVGQVPFQQLSGREFTVRDEIAFGPGNLALDPREIHRRVEHVMTLCGLDSLADRDPYTLSAGEQQMVVIANALAMNPRVLVLDEPTASLDPQSAECVWRVLSGLSTCTTIVLFDVSPRAAVRMAHRFLFLREGRFIADGSAEDVLLHPLAISSLGLPPTAEAAWLAKQEQVWALGVGTPFTVDGAVTAFREVERARR